MRAHFLTLAEYNRWANRRLYDAAAAVDGPAYHEPRGAFFGSLHATLNHLLVGDRIWLHRLTGTGTLPSRLNEILFDDLPALRRAREAEDERLIAVVGALGDADWERLLHYKNISGTPQATIVREVLAHLFNHQTHHRGQAHAILTGLGRASVELDLILYLRSRPAAAEQNP